MSDDKIKKTRRQWLFEDGELSTKEATFNLATITNEADLFLKLYGCKQYLSDCIANKGGSEFSDAERGQIMETRFANLCNGKFKLTHTESGFSFKDPDAVAVKRGSVFTKKIYDACINDGKTPEQATAFTLQVTGKTYPEKE